MTHSQIVSFAETKGSGIRVMRRDLAPASFHSDREHDEFVATLFLHNLLTDDHLRWLAGFADLNLTTDEQRALVHVREGGRITNADRREMAGVETLEASSRLRRMRDLGLLEQQDRGSVTFYTPSSRVVPEEEGIGGPGVLASEQSDKLGEQSHQLGEQSDEGIRQSDEPPEKSDKGGNGPAAEKDQRDDVSTMPLTPIPQALAEEVAALNRWTPQPRLKALIVRLCAWKPLSADELASILGRTRTYLRTEYIGPMVRAGDLAYTNPERPTDPLPLHRRANERSPVWGEMGRPAAQDGCRSPHQQCGQEVR